MNNNLDNLYSVNLKTNYLKTLIIEFNETLKLKKNLLSELENEDILYDMVQDYFIEYFNSSIGALNWIKKYTYFNLCDILENVINLGYSLEDEDPNIMFQESCSDLIKNEIINNFQIDNTTKKLKYCNYD